jgi:hypothetical protein
MRTCLRTRDISNLLITTDRSNYCANVVLLRSSISNVIATKTQPFVVPGRIPVDPTTLASYFRTLKRQRVVRNRSNGNPTTQSKRADRLLVLPELSREQDGSPSSLFSISSSSSVPSSSTPFCSTGPKAKRLSCYGKEELGAFALTDNFFSAPPRVAPRPPSASPPSLSSSTKSMRQTVSRCIRYNRRHLCVQASLACQ